jgi:hypothetical protein
MWTNIDIQTGRPALLPTQRTVSRDECLVERCLKVRFSVNALTIFGFLIFLSKTLCLIFFILLTYPVHSSYCFLMMCTCKCKQSLQPVLTIRIGFNADPDPGFYLNADPDPVRIQGAKPMRIRIMVRL